MAINVAGEFVAFDQAAEALFGHSAADVMGRQMAELIIPEPLREAHHDGMARYMRTKEPFLIGRTIEITALHADGSVFPVELTLNVASESPLVIEGLLRRTAG